MKLDPSTVPDLFSYENGILYWRKRPDPRACRISPGSVAGNRDSRGFGTIQIFKERYSTAAVVWAYHCGRWPIGPLGHVNGDNADDRIENLKLRYPLHAERDGGRNNVKQEACQKIAPDLEFFRKSTPQVRVPD